MPSPIPALSGQRSATAQALASVNGQSSVPGALQALPSISAVVEQVRPWVASITVESLVRGLFYDFTDEGAGSGLVVRPDGYVVTNFHVVQGVRDIKVHLPNGDTYDARIVGGDAVTDIAVLKIDAQGLPTATFADSDVLKVGDWVMTMGNALALRGGPTVTLGIVSGLGRTITTERGQFYDLIQTDAAINSGNSGGPLVKFAGLNWEEGFGLEGHVVGINQAMQRQAPGIGFVISSSVAEPIIESLIDHGRVVRPLIGLVGQDVTAAIANELGLNVTEGIIVSSMSRSGPAYQVGIRVGDVVTKMDDIATPDMASFLTMLWSYEVGDQVQVEYIHNNEVLIATLELSERP